MSLMGEKPYFTQIRDNAESQKKLREEFKKRNQERISGNNSRSLEHIDEYWPIIRASELSLNNLFLKHKPRTENQQQEKELIIRAIKSGLKDFRTCISDPSFSDDDKTIVFRKRALFGSSSLKSPITYKPIEFWENKSKEILPEKNSRIAENKLYDAFLGVLIKDLVKSGVPINKAWEMVCDNSHDLGHFGSRSKSENIKVPVVGGGFKYKYVQTPYLEATGSRGYIFHSDNHNFEIRDLGNTYKIVKDEESQSGYSRRGNSYKENPGRLSCYKPNLTVICDDIPWIVCDV